MWKEFSSMIWDFRAEGQKVLEGVFAGWDEFHGGDFGVCNRYLVDHDLAGRVSFIGGTAFDKIFKQADLVVGEKVRVEYQGQKDLKDGKRVNLFRLMIDRKEDDHLNHPTPKKAKK